MSYSFDSARLLDRLYGQVFSVPNSVTGRAEMLEIRPKKIFPARRGLEAYGVRVLHRHAKGDVHAFLKIFKADVPERRERSEFLITRGLARLHEWAFQGVPYGWFNRGAINEVEVVGHLTKFIGLQYGTAAEDFEVLKSGGEWDLHAMEERRGFVAHLAVAVDALERMRITHADLSHGNIMIGAGPDGRTVCCLCDFDGFAHPNVPLLPRRFEGMDVRPLGSEGYQYPELLARVNADPGRKDAALHVGTDRFALAVLACEMMVWSSDLEVKLGARTTLLTDDMILRRRLDGIPDDVRGRFPEGFRLLERALQAGSCEDMPAPGDWLDLFDVPAPSATPFRTPPFLQVFDRRGVRRLFRRALLNGRRTGDLGILHQDLAEISYRVGPDQVLSLTVGGRHPAELHREGRRQSLKPDSRGDLVILPGDALVFADFELLFENATPDAFSGRRVGL